MSGDAANARTSSSRPWARAQGRALRFINNHFGRRLIHFELGVGFLDLRSVLVQLGCEHLYLLLLLRDRCSQVLNFQIERGLLGGVGNDLGLDTFGKRLTGISAGSHANRAQPSIGIDVYYLSNPAHVINVCAPDVPDIADVIFLVKATMHTRMVADDDVVINAGDPRPGQSAYDHVLAGAHAVLER